MPDGNDIFNGQNIFLEFNTKDLAEFVNFVV